MEYRPPPVPEELLTPVEVDCSPGSTAGDLGNCVLAKVQGLDEANSKILSLADILKSPG